MWYSPPLPSGNCHELITSLVNTTIRIRKEFRRTHLRRSWLLSLVAVTSTMVGGCQQFCCKSGKHPSALAAETALTSPRLPAGEDPRLPLPLLPRMAQHQLEKMRDHLATIQEIMDALSQSDFVAVARASARIGYNEQMEQMCERMGVGAPGFNEMGLAFHRTADTIDAAARQKDTAATLKAVAATLHTCVACHSAYRQQIVDEAAWEKIMSHRRATIP